MIGDMWMEDEDMKANTFMEVVAERYELCNKDYSEAYYDLANIFEEYLEYLGKKGDKTK